MSLEGNDLLPARGIPDARNAVLVLGQHPPPVGAERGAFDRASVPLENGDLITGDLAVPNPRRPISRRRRHATPVGAECRAPNGLVMALEKGDVLADVDVPYAR